MPGPCYRRSTRESRAGTAPRRRPGRSRPRRASTAATPRSRARPAPTTVRPREPDPARGRARPAAEPAPLRVGRDLEAELPPIADARARRRAPPASSSATNTRMSRAVARRAFDARVIVPVDLVQPRRRARAVPMRHSSASNVAGSRIEPFAPATSSDAADIGTEKSPGGIRAATSAGSMSAASTKWPVKPTIASASPPGDGTTSTTPSAGGNRPRAGVVEQRRAADARSRPASSSSTAVYGIARALGDLVDERLEPRSAAHAPTRVRAARPRRARAAPRAGAPGAARRRRPSPRGCARCAAIASHSSSTPSPVVATVRTIGGRHAAPARQLEHALEVAHGLGRAGPVGLVHDEHVGDLQQPGLRGLHRVAPARVHDDDRRVGVARRSRPRPGRRRPSRSRSTPCRPRRARAPPAASRARGRRGARASPSSG